MKLNRNNFTEFFRCDFNLATVTFDLNERYTGTAYAKLYTYKIPKSWDVKAGDQLLVRVNNGALPPAYKSVTIESINDKPQIDGSKTFEHKWAVMPMSSLLVEYDINNDRDTKLKEGLNLLERALERAMLKTQLEDALKMVDEETQAKLRSLFTLPEQLDGPTDSTPKS